MLTDRRGESYVAGRQCTSRSLFLSPPRGLTLGLDTRPRFHEMLSTYRESFGRARETSLVCPYRVSVARARNI